MKAMIGAFVIVAITALTSFIAGNPMPQWAYIATLMAALAAMR